MDAIQEKKGLQQNLNAIYIPFLDPTSSYFWSLVSFCCLKSLRTSKLINDISPHKLTHPFKGWFKQEGRRSEEMASPQTSLNQRVKKVTTRVEDNGLRLKKAAISKIP